MWASFKKFHIGLCLLFFNSKEIQIFDLLSGFISLVLDSLFNAALQNYFLRDSSRFFKTSADVYCTK